MDDIKVKYCYMCDNFDELYRFKRSNKPGYFSECLSCRKGTKRKPKPNNIQCAYSRNASLRSNYGIGIEEYKQMFVLQNGLCAICKQPETETYRGVVRNLSVDHDHKTSQIRGLLCKQCNAGLGKFKDNTELLAAAIAYLNLHRSVNETNR